MRTGALSSAGPRTADPVAIGPELRSLVETYVSYLSGCDPCATESLRLARGLESDPLRLHLLSTWRRAPRRTYSERERVALVWTEVVAALGEQGVGEALRRQASELFSAEEMVALTEVVLATHGYRRLVLERVDHARIDGSASRASTGEGTCGCSGGRRLHLRSESRRAQRGTPVRVEIERR